MVTPGRGPKTKTFGAALGVPGVKVKTAWFTHITVRGSYILFTQTGSAACVTDLFLCTLAVTVTARRTVREGVEAGQTVVTLTAPNIVLTRALSSGLVTVHVPVQNTLSITFTVSTAH